MKEQNIRRIVTSLLGVIMARAVFMGINPFAMGYLAALFLEPKGRILSMVMVALGVVSVMGISEMIKYLIAIIVFSILVSMVEYRSKKINIWAMGGIAAAVTTVLTCFYSTLNSNIGYYIMMGFAEGVIVFVSAPVFRKGLESVINPRAKSEVLSNEEIIGLAVMGGVIIYSIPDMKSLGFSLPLTCAMFSVLIIGFRYGAGFGAVIGAAGGIIMALRTGELNQLGLMCMLGIISGSFREMGRIVDFLAYAGGFLVLGELYKDSKLNLEGFGVLISCAVLFFLLPKNLIYGKGTGESDREEEVFVHQNLQSIARGKLRDFSESFHNLSTTFHSISEQKEGLDKLDKRELFDQLSEKLCKDCENCSFCWEGHFYETYEGAYRIMEQVNENGTVSLNEIPGEFTSRCICLDNFLEEAKRSIEVARINMTWSNKLAQSRAAIAEQLGEVANIIDDFSLDLYKPSEEEGKKEKIASELRRNHIMAKKVAIFEKRDGKKEIYLTARTDKGRCITVKEAAGIIGKAYGKPMRPYEGCKKVIAKEPETFTFVEDTDYMVYTGFARMNKEKNPVSGDNYSFLNPDTGTFIMSLADGMGTGQGAYEESESVIELLEQFMEAGFRKESAIKLINSIMVLRDREESFSTIDLTIINLYTGFCDFIKMGAAATFLKKAGEVEVIHSTSLPAGIIQKADYEIITKKLYSGEFVIMATDGVVDCIPGEDKDEFISEFLKDLKTNNPKEMANALLNMALEQNGWVPVDDMTVLVAGFWSKA
ncbi:stage II sporulation protein E [Anaerocolumna xylanovorans]|uniref:Stage II sporulation protein E n=1 Tax=Anaerocolumna xylanovorans DSM 12503 TaxID=1121345 RepID=A0A1M7Y6N4_9FIRM|nr:stage II sporulation protein E [Anaerocolumna xylanovorans]SHO48251.1 stage II sporulation protein E [Anaerocolumna xylanovorans DSM 12503]